MARYIERVFRIRDRLRVGHHDLLLANAGKKAGTVRLGTVSITQPEVSLTDGRSSLRVRITGVEHGRRFRDLTEDDARMDGFSTKEELQADLRRWYGNVHPDQPMTIIRFVLLSDEGPSQTPLFPRERA